MSTPYNIKEGQTRSALTFYDAFIALRLLQPAMLVPAWPSRLQ